jgi:hypothetical protein
VLAHDDPFWDVYFPPNGWGCTCYISGISKGRLAQLGKEGPDAAPEIVMEQVTVGANSATPRVVDVAQGTDPGWSYAPGRDAWLHAQAARAVEIADAQAATEWEQIIETTAADLGRPAQLPVVAPPVELGARLPDAAAVTAELQRLIGAPSIVVDVRGLPVIVDAASLGSHIDPSRSEYLPLLLDVLIDPFEVWIALERSISGDYRTRARILKRYDLERAGTVLVVADRQDGAMITWTVVPTGDVRYINRQRRGVLWWGKPE